MLVRQQFKIYERKFKTVHCIFINDFLNNFDFRGCLRWVFVKLQKVVCAFGTTIGIAG